MSADGQPQTLPFRYDRSDFVALAELGRPRIAGWLFRLGWGLFAVAGVLIAICLLAGSLRVLWFVPALLLLLAGYLLLHRHGANIGAWAINRRARRDDLLREQRMTVAADCFRAQSSRGKTEVRWSAIPRIHEADTRLFVYSTRRQAFIIPERAFEGREDFLAFVAAAKDRWAQHHRM
jgi:hypothetical protein